MRKSVGKQWFFALILVLFGLQIVANPRVNNHLFVAPDGDDQATGTVDHPLQTLGAAIDLVQTGGTISLAPGTYREGELKLTKGGTEDQPLRIEGAGMEQTIIKGSQEVGNWTAHTSGVWKTSWAINSQQVFSDGVHLQQIGSSSPWHTQGNRLPPQGSGLDDLVPGSFYWDRSTNTLYVSLANEGNPNQHLMEASVESYLLNGGDVSHVILRDLTLAHTNGTHDGGRGYCLRLYNDNWTVENCRFLYPDYAGIFVKGIHHRIRDCEILYAGNVGLDVYNSNAANNYTWYRDAPHMDLIIEGCEVSYNNYRLFRAAWHAGGMKMIPATKGVIVRNNTVRYNKAPGIWIDTPIGENRIENNLVIGNETGIFYEIAREIDTLPAAFGGIICNNIVIGDKKQGIYVSGSSDVEVKNNTVYDCWAGIVMHGMPRGDYVLKNNSIHHNIMNGNTIGELIAFVGTNSENHSIHDNFYVTGVSINGNPARSHPRIGIVTGTGYGANYTDLATLRANTTFGDGALQGDPMWTDPAQYHFELLPGSPAVGKGITGTSSCELLAPPPLPDTCVVPAGWGSLDIGFPALEGEACQDSLGFIHVAASGDDIWYGEDAFHFLHQTYSGDGQITVQVREVDSVHEFTKAGVMMRSSLDPDAANAMMYLSPVGRWSFQRRTTSGGISVSTKSDPGAISFPHWVRLSRTANEISAYHSADGQVWTLVGTDLLPFSTDLTLGLAVTSHADNQLAQATFSNLTISSGGSTSFPVELLDFRAELHAYRGMVQLEWRTALEENNHYFSLDRSSDGTIFQRLAEVPASLAGGNGASYQWWDSRPLLGTSYYRLSQTDLDGRTQILETQEITYLEEGAGLLFFFSNPIQEGEVLEVVIEKNLFGVLPWKLLNNQGQEVLAGRLGQDDQRLRIPTDALAPGLYYLSFFSGISAPVLSRSLLVLQN